MADLSQDAPLRIWGEAYVEKFHCDSSAAMTVYKGHPMVIDQTKDSLYADAWDDSTLAADDVFLGIAAEGKTVESGDSETDVDSLIKVYVEPTIVGFKSAVFTNTNLGATVYMSDSGTLSDTAADNPQIGKLHRVEDGYCYVRLETPKICTGA